MATKKPLPPDSVTAIKVRQWIESWEKVAFDASSLQARPLEHFYLCSIRASHLKSLTGVYRRSVKTGTPRAKDPNVQRGHEEERSAQIGQFVRYGFPWCEMGEAKRRMPGADALRKPGWLPTAVIVNILPVNSSRNGVKISANDLVRVDDGTDTAKLHMPKSFSGGGWEPETVFPLEVIDGQHRLWAFEDFDPGDDFELPVVAFHGLDRSWQAYIFWSVNITPKKINRSLAFDLYPLLRQEDWLDSFAGHSIYRETRCQELVESLWSHPDSPWHQRINMLGETKDQRESRVQMVSQAAWIRSLMASVVKQWESSGTKLGGLFGAPQKSNEIALPWNRPMQAAILIFAGKVIRDAIKKSKAKWAENLRQVSKPVPGSTADPAFYGEYSLLSTDQGIRGFLFTINDLCFVECEDIELPDWRWDDVYQETGGKQLSATDDEVVTAAIKSISKKNVAAFLNEIAEGLSTYDWRTSSTPGLKESERLKQSIFRGSSGYKELRRQILLHLQEQDGRVANAAAKVAEMLGYT